MKHLKSFNESHTKEYHDFNDIFIHLIDFGLELDIKKVYFSDRNTNTDESRRAYTTSDNPNQYYRKPGYIATLNKKITDFVDINLIKNIFEELEESNDRLSEFGETYIERIDISSNNKINIVYHLIDEESNEEVPVEKEGFYEFLDVIKRNLDHRYTKVTRAFKYSQDRNGVVLLPIEDGFESKTLLSDVKTFIRKLFEPKFRYLGGQNWRWKYDIELKDNKIHINFIERVNRP